MTSNSQSTYQCCLRCTAKWFGDRALQACPRCGALPGPTVMQELPFTTARGQSTTGGLLSAAARLLARIPPAQRTDVLLDSLTGTPPFRSRKARRLSRLFHQVVASSAEDLQLACVRLILEPPMRKSIERLVERVVTAPTARRLKPLLAHVHQRSRSDELQVVNNVYRSIQTLLRHGGQGDRLEVDPYGWASASTLLGLINNRSLDLQLWRDWQFSDLLRQERLCRGERIQVDVDRQQVRALYGHSCADVCAGSPEVPPSILFHGTSLTVTDSIFENGLKPAERTMAHLTSDLDYAESVARKLASPIVLGVDSAAASNAGVYFWKCNSHVWQCSFVPATFVHEFTRSAVE